MSKTFFELLEIRKRTSKPREIGINVVMDQNLGFNLTRDLIDTAADYIDFIKLGFSTWTVMPPELVSEKIRLYRNANINVMPGGTTFEIAYLRKKIPEFFEYVTNLGFNAIEIPESSLAYRLNEKSIFIKQAVDYGFIVTSEVGRKFPEDDSKISLDQRVALIKADLDAGATKVTIEARDSGKAVGIYDNSGSVKQDVLDGIVAQIDPKYLIFEAPNKNQQVYLLNRFGQDVNLGNIKPYEEGVVALETMRQGVRADTLGRWW